MKGKVVAGTCCLLIALAAPFAYGSAADESEESASTLCKILDGLDALTQACEFSTKNRTVNIVIDGAPTDAEKLCPEINALVEQNDLAFTEGWAVEIVSSRPDYAVIGTCPL
ncbi:MULTISPECIES: hypothetical protein [Pseudomonas]|uniref:hypothetical protein n=1 Tax=Pseudomonas TaxID=286 RepID=UPI000AE4612F|nr:hypothetical protein [Pseudomonas sp. Pf153]MCE0459891.1 hypothetical protein [Pseudomonas uvaldensis]